MTVIVVEGGPCGNVPFGVDFSERQHGRDAGVAVAEDVRPVVAVMRRECLGQRITDLGPAADVVLVGQVGGIETELVQSSA
jgi:hypothetical protein